MMTLLTIQSIPCYKPIYLGRGRKPSIRKDSVVQNLTDISLFTSRGDGNLFESVSSFPFNEGYKPIYLARGRKQFYRHRYMIVCFDQYKPICLARGRKHLKFSITFHNFPDINLSTSRGDGNNLLKVPLLYL